jgi:phosphatidate cytidylyltransferase
MSQFLKRFITVTFIILYLFFLYFFGNNFFLIVTIYIIVLISFYEWTKLQSKSKFQTSVFFGLLLLIHYFNSMNIYYISLLSLFFWIYLILYMLINSEGLKYFLKNNNNLIGFIIFSILFIHLINLSPKSTPLSAINNLSDNMFYFLLLIYIVSVIDTSAYIIGKSIGKHKIVTNISPNKTLEGYIGSYILSLFFFIIFFNMNNMIWTNTDLIFLSLFILLAFFGDLFISLIKRAYNVKDTSNILPGHGGLLDRLDSYLPSLPLFYLWFMT